MQHFKKIWIAICFILAIAMPASAQVVEIKGPFLDLRGEHKFNVGDDLAWADPDFDDANWKNAKIPGIWLDYGVNIDEQFGWYRVRFQMPKDNAIEDAAFVGYLLQQDEVYLNGEKIGGQGKFLERNLVFRPDIPAGLMRVYSLPKGLVSYEEENVLAIRLNRIRLIEEGGVAPYVFGIGERARALALKSPFEQTYAAIDGLLVGINLILACIAVTLVAAGMRDRALTQFAALISVTLFGQIVDSYTLAAAIQYTSWLQLLRLCVTFTAMYFLLQFVSSILQVNLGKIGRAAQALAIGSAILAVPSFFWAPMGEYYIYLALFSVISISIFHFCWIIYASRKSIIAGAKVGWFVLISYTLTVSLPAIVNLLCPSVLSPVAHVIGRWPYTLTSQLFFLCLSAIAGYRLYQIEEARLVANERALSAQANERKRVARDIHDGVGQYLGSLKMRLQNTAKRDVLGGDAVHNQLDELVGDVDVLIDDTRRIARDLSPSSVSHKGLKAALNDHLEQLRDDHGLRYDLAISPDLTLDETHADHIYRIVQEATHNAVFHGSASNLSVQIEDRLGQLKTLTISDDGSGFDSPKPNERHSLGMTSIAERSEMMNAKIDIQSNAETDTKIRIEF